MVNYLIDTNVISEFRKEHRAHPAVLRWIGRTAPEEHHTSVLVLGELRHGIELVRRHDERQAGALERWLSGMIAKYQGRVLPVSAAIADYWGRLGIPDPIPEVDGLLAATAIVHDLTLVTRDQALLGIKGVKAVNPFS